MKIVSFGPLSFQRPYIPKYIYFDDGSRVSEFDDSSDESTEILKTPVDLPDDLWIAIMEDGSVETFPRGKSKEWAAKKASEMISSVMAPTGDPLGRIEVIKQAASLVGISIHELMAAVVHFGDKNTSLEESLLLMQEKGGRIQ